MNNRAPNILLVEDESNDALLFALAVEEAGLDLNTQRVTDGQDAMDYLSGHGRYAARASFPFPDVVVLDLRMPKVSGTDFLKWCRASPALKDLPVAVLTGSLAGDRELRSALAAGANRTFLKPCDPAKLRELVQQIYDFALEARAPGPKPWECSSQSGLRTARPRVG